MKVNVGLLLNMVLFLTCTADMLWSEVCTIQMDWVNNNKQGKMNGSLI